MNNVLSRLTVLTINIVGAVVALVLALILYFAMVKPKADQVTTTQADTATTQQSGGTDEQISSHKRDLAKTQKLAQDTTANWRVNEVKYMPDISMNSDILKAYESQLIKLPADWGKWVQKWYDAQRKYGITLESGGFPVESFPTDPNYIASLTSLKFPQNGAWPVSVEAKTFDAGMFHLRQFNNMGGHGMPVVDNVSLAGQSPNLQMNYTLALYIIPAKTPPASDPFLTAGTSSAGGMGGGMGGMPGMGGGMGGGMPGMPGMGSGKMARMGMGGGMPSPMGANLGGGTK